MSRFFKKRFLLGLVAIVILAALVGISVTNRKQLTWPEQFLKDSIGFVQDVFQKPAEAVVGFFENISHIQNTYEENKVLKKHLDEYTELYVRVKELEKQNAEYKKLLGKEASLTDYDRINASVITRNPDAWNDLIMIDKGETDGVEKDMAVITADGLIGKVKSVSQFTATIQLISSRDRTNKITAVVQSDKRIFGLVEGYDEEKQMLVFQKIPAENKVKKGQMVVSSGLGGVFPRGLIIGRIQSVELDSYGLTQTAFVEPAANIYDLNEVIVVKRKLPAGEVEQ
ncbi:MAG: rod shape-determining protein MreC [Bacilli bacterium]